MVRDQKDEESIFHAALAKPVAERPAYLQAACGSDPELLGHIESLLIAYDVRDGFLETPAVGENVALDGSCLTEGPGTVIGRYKLLEKIGEGGMAVVYMAEQQEPIRRKVALKIIKLGMDTRQVIARFEAERQALAMMDHPSIAKVLDAGATETGWPYFVMELVTGVSITEYCDKNNLSTKDRLALFLQVCNAVQHAHQKGIIHRDIKPSNVMVAHHDGKPVPKVIDFGIAKATNQRLTEKTLFTRYAHIIGTPAYMSPEQAELSDLDIDTRTDIYSLGVLLYELLTGTTPFSEEELRKAGYIEMQRVIREQEPAKPSTKLTTLGDILTEVAKHRNATPDLLRRAVQGDLDWIVMKSLEKDRSRRYETANGLAEDIRRHLEHEPVFARGPSTTYRLQKFLRRHRAQAVAALAIALVAGAAVVVLSLWNRDRLQLAEAEGFRHRGILSQAREQYARADRDAALETIAPILHSGHVGPEAQLLQAGILADKRRSDEAVTILNSLLGGRPEIAGAAHSLLARILWESESPNAEKLKEIEEHRRKAEALLPETAEAYFLRAMTAVTVKEQLASLDKALQLDPTHYESRRLRAFTYYASRKYDKMKDDALVMAVSRPRDPLGYSLRAIALRELGKYQEAITEYESAMVLTPKDDPQYIDLSAQRCETFLRMGDYERAITEAQERLKLWPDKPVFQYHTFCALTALGDYERATALFRVIVGHTPTSRSEFQDWSMKYVFDTLEAGRSWHPVDREPAGAAFLPMVEAQETYRDLSAKARPIVTNGFSAHWSPDGSKLAFSLGVHGYSGVAIYDPATKETELLIVPGKDPRWSPDGRYIAFVRDCQTLRLEELTIAERKDQVRWAIDEEVWVMNADGIEPRRLARGGWPSWGKDSTHVYYHSRLDRMLYAISIVGPDVEPKRIMACSNFFPSVSPDNQRVAYVEGTSLTVRDLASQALVAEWRVPFGTWGGPAWSPASNELCLGAGSSVGDRTGLWIYRADSNEPAKVLGSQIMAASWAPDGTKLVFGLRPPYFELWAASLDPAISTMEALGPGQTLDEHWRQMLRLYTRRMQADPQDAYAYSDRARYYDYLHDRAKANADMRRWSAILSQGASSDSRSGAPGNLRRVINMPLDCQLVFSIGRRENGIPVLCVAFGQKGRCEMKLFEIPMLAMSLVGLGLLSGFDAPPAHADFAFGDPENLGSGINSSAFEFAPRPSADGLVLYFHRVTSVLDEPTLWMATRATKEDPWGVPVCLGPCTDSSSYQAMTVVPSYTSADGLEVYFSDMRPGGYGGEDLWMMTRKTIEDPWSPWVNLGPAVNSWADEQVPALSPDGLELYFSGWRDDYARPGTYGYSDLWVTKRATRNDPWGEPVNLGPAVNTAYQDKCVTLSVDGLSLFFDSQRPGGYGQGDLYMTRRATLSSPWGKPVNLGPIANSPAFEEMPCISADSSTLYYDSDRPGGYGSNDIWQVPMIAIVDFDGDGKVDGKEVLAMAEHWGRSESLYDMGPTPIGDGVVDAKDLTVLAGYIGQEVNDPSLIAHWALDETAGMTAADSAGDNDAMVLGNAPWQPAGGKIGGALLFDGKDDFVRSGSVVLDPAAGPFSVIAWVKGGAPNRVIISQASGADWLYLNQFGMLTTDLKASGKDGRSLTSDAYVLDDQWHRVALVWDGTNRTLQMDGVEVAKDTQPSLAASSGNLHLGCGKIGGSFWSGLIDDVRIYNRVVQP